MGKFFYLQFFDKAVDNFFTIAYGLGTPVDFEIQNLLGGKLPWELTVAEPRGEGEE